MFLAAFIEKYLWSATCHVVFHKRPAAILGEGRTTYALYSHTAFPRISVFSATDLRRLLMSNEAKRAILSLLFVVGLFSLAVTSHAQQISGDLVGTVIDASGAVVPNASLTAENVATGFKLTATANGAGEFRFGNLPIGAYRVSASAPNFEPATAENVAVQVNKANSLQITLQLQSVSATVEVTSAPPLINTTNPQIEGTFETAANANLPTVSGRGDGVLNLALLQPGVSSAQGVGIGAGPSVG